MISTLKELKGNPRIAVLTEPLWGIPHFLYIPFASVYMAAFGLSDARIGLIASLVMLVRAASAALSGAVTDKLGRRMTTLVFDVLSWSVPCLLWATAQGPQAFFVAALFNGMWEITNNSWSCLLVEEAEKRLLVHIYSWIYVGACVSVFFAPIAGLLVSGIGLVTAVRILYAFSFVLMTLKFIIMYLYSTETQIGKQRMEETRGVPLLSVLAEYRGLLPRFFHSKEMMTAMILAILFTITGTVTESFFGIYATRTLLLPEGTLIVFPMIRSTIMLLFLFIVQPRLEKFGFRKPMLIGVALFIVGNAVLIVPPLFISVNALVLPVVYTVIQSCALALATVRKDAIVALSLQHEERARMTSIMTVFMLSLTTPFGSLAGALSEINRSLPFALNILLFAIVFAVVFFSGTIKTMGQTE